MDRYLLDQTSSVYTHCPQEIWNLLIILLSLFTHLFPLG